MEMASTQERNLIVQDQPVTLELDKSFEKDEEMNEGKTKKNECEDVNECRDEGEGEEAARRTCTDRSLHIYIPQRKPPAK